MKKLIFTTIFVLALAALVSAQPPSVSNRAADVRVTFSESRTYKGNYTGRAIARYCGQTDPMYFGQKVWGVEYPLDLPPGDPIEDVTFHSAELVDGMKATAGFFVSVNVNSPVMGHPAAWVVDTLNPNHHASGRATLTGTNTETTLTVNAVNSLGEKLELVVTCHPPRK